MASNSGSALDTALLTHRPTHSVEPMITAIDWRGFSSQRRRPGFLGPVYAQLGEDPLAFCHVGRFGNLTCCPPLTQHTELIHEASLIVAVDLLGFSRDGFPSLPLRFLALYAASLPLSFAHAFASTSHLRPTDRRWIEPMPRHASR